MTTITYKGIKNKARKQVVERAVGNESTPSTKRATHPERTNSSKRALSQDGTRTNERANQIERTKGNERDGPRCKEVKSILDGRSAEQRVKRLVKLARAQGIEKLENEIVIHERKIAELRLALIAAAAPDGSCPEAAAVATPT